jgi:hypothetical protein
MARKGRSSTFRDRQGQNTDFKVKTIGLLRFVFVGHSHPALQRKFPCKRESSGSNDAQQEKNLIVRITHLNSVYIVESEI